MIPFRSFGLYYNMPPFDFYLMIHIGPAISLCVFPIFFNYSVQCVNRLLAHCFHLMLFDFPPWLQSLNFLRRIKCCTYITQTQQEKWWEIWLYRPYDLEKIHAIYLLLVKFHQSFPSKLLRQNSEHPKLVFLLISRLKNKKQKILKYNKKVVSLKIGLCIASFITSCN